MTYSPSRDMASVIENDSSSQWVFGTNLFISMLPSTPDVAVGLLDSSGGSNNDMNKDEHVFSVQIRVRGKVFGYETAYQHALAIYNLLEGYPTTDIQGTRYILIRAMGNVGFLQYDENDRPIFVMNFYGKRSVE
jgi:hypothetical protein